MKVIGMPERKNLEHYLNCLPRFEPNGDLSDRVMEKIYKREAILARYRRAKKFVVFALAGVFLLLVFLTNLPLLPEFQVTDFAGYRTVELIFYPPSKSPHTVAVAGDFTNWDALAMQKVKDDCWKITVRLKPGKYQYAFVIDGKEWIPDPSSPRRVSDGFGGFNSVLVVNGG